MEHQIILFDGYCNLCSSAVKFIITHDPKGHFRFSSLESVAGKNLLSARAFSVQDNKSILLLDGNKIYSRSTAALRIARKLNGILPILYVFMIIPRVIRDTLYNFIAINRYKWFGKKEQCMVPTVELRARFLE